MDTDELNQLIRSLNQGAASDRREATGPELELVRPEEPAPDLALTAKIPPTGEDELPPGLVALLSETVRRGATDLLLVPGASLGLPEMLYDLTKAARGLILVTGATGSGKTTTLAALVDRMNRTEKRHIVTIEDPVEYEHTHARSLVEQVEVGVDVPGFAAALVAALRQDPDVILVGEMRDLETTRAAVTAAETGHLVLTTLHTNDVPQTINRILDIFPAEQQAQVKHQLSLALSAIVCQQLVPRKDGSGRAVAVEVLVATDSIRAHIRRGSFHQIHTELTLGKRFGMMTMEDSLAALVQAGTISEAEARLRASHPDDLASRLAGGRAPA